MFSKTDVEQAIKEIENAEKVLYLKIQMNDETDHNHMGAERVACANLSMAVTIFKSLLEEGFHV